MSNFRKIDNTSFDQKASIRKAALELIDNPIIMETHAGIGDIYRAIYYPYERGIAMEKDGFKCEILAHQRPSWAVYQADSPLALTLGAGGHLGVNFLDVDPYGDSWPTIQAFFSSTRPFPRRMVLAVNDGLRQKIRTGGGWDSKTLQPVVRVMGNDLWHRYLDACRLLLGDAIKSNGYHITKFSGYYTGEGKKLTHFIALLEK